MKRSFRLPLVLTSIAALGLAASATELFAPRAQSRGNVRRLPIARDDPRTPIRSLPFTINACGSYFLADCLTGEAGQNGITITADDVTLDLNGFTLQGVPGSANGVEVQASHNVSVINGHVEGWVGDGVLAASVQGGLLSDVQASNNGGSGLVIGIGGLVEGCTAASNGADGIVAGFGSSVFDCSASGNAGDGIVGAIAATVTGCTIRSCTARSNGDDGIETGDGCTVSGCSATLNADDGIAVGNGSVVSGNAATLNGGNGIVAFDSLVRGNAARNNAGTQINAADSTVIENHQ